MYSDALSHNDNDANVVIIVNAYDLNNVILEFQSALLALLLINKLLVIVVNLYFGLMSGWGIWPSRSELDKRCEIFHLLEMIVRLSIRLSSVLERQMWSHSDLGEVANFCASGSVFSFEMCQLLHIYLIRTLF